VRVFVGIDVGEAVRQEAARAVAQVAAAMNRARTPPRVVWVAPADLHVTLRFLGEVAADRCAGLVARFRDPFPQPPFEVEWRGLGAFPSPRHPRALWLGAVGGGAALGQLESSVTERVDGFDRQESRPLHPHVTIGRVKTDGAGVDWPAILLEADVRGVRTAVTRVVLYQSHGTPRGAHYTELASAPLHAPVSEREGEA